ncbi:MAG: ABC transporter ATP-binding protein [Phycisphaeraceae bacterium]|nr:ABC transporter ATP-binding protein [Phycisphaeraceae bacterium]
MTVYPGQTLAVVGESGCGKSVTAMSALQLIPCPPGRIDRGQVLFETSARLGWGEVDLLKLPSDRMRQIRGREVAMIFQEPMTSLNPVYSIGDQIVEAIRLHQEVSWREAREVAISAMTEVGIPDPAGRMKAYPHQFSGGMRQRVMIAIALACKPRVLLADEPTTALDVTIQAQILDLLGELKRSRGLGIMLVTHDLGVVAEQSDVVCVMYAGRVVEYARVLDLFEAPLHPYTRGLLACIPKMHDRRDRLVTVREVTEDPTQFERQPGIPEGVRPWWPWHSPPADLRRVEGPAGEYALVEVSPGHWVGAWRTEGVSEALLTMPDLEPTSGDAAKAVTSGV